MTRRDVAKYRNRYKIRLGVKLKLSECVDPAYGEDAFLLTDQARVPAITSDVHSLWAIGTEVWAIDQAATGSVQTYEIFSKCAAYKAE